MCGYASIGTEFVTVSLIFYYIITPPSDSRVFFAIFGLFGNTDKSVSIQINILVNIGTALYNHTERAL